MTDRTLLDVIRDLHESGLSPEQHVLLDEFIIIASNNAAAAALEIEQQRLLDARKKAAERKQKWRMSRNVPGHLGTSNVPLQKQPVSAKNSPMSHDVPGQCGTLDLVSPKKINKTPSRNRAFNQEVKISVSRHPPPQNPPVSRLPADWHPSEMLWQKAKDKFAMSQEALEWETTKFRDYWHAKPKDACKANWDAAWRNWMQRAVESHHTGGNGQHRSTGPPRETIGQAAMRVGMAMEEWDKQHEGHSGSIFSGLLDERAGQKIRDDDGK